MIGMDIKEVFAGTMRGLGLFFQQCKRVLLVASKPGKEEFVLSAKITGIGIAIIGMIGFLLFMLFQVFSLS